MGCLDSLSVKTNNNNNNNNYHYSRSYSINPNYINNNVDTDDFNEGDFPHFQPYYYDKNIKNIKKVYEERIKEGNNIKVKIHKILILINYVERNTTTIQIEIEKLDGRTIKKHLTQLFNNECSLDNVRSLLEKYNPIFKIDSKEWYKSKSSSDIYIKAEKINNNLYKIFEMFYEKDISRLKLNKKIKYGNSDKSSEAIYSNINPGEVVKKYNELKSIYYDNNPEIFDYAEEPNEIEESDDYNYYSNKINYSNKKNYSNNNNNSYQEESNNSGKRNSDCSIYRDGQRVGKVYRDGEIYMDGKKGKFYNDGEVYMDGKKGKIYDDGEIRVDDKAGKVYDDGDVYVDGRKVGKIYDDGDVYKDGHKIGNASGMSKEQAAYIYFFS